MSTKYLKDDGIVFVQTELLSLKKRLEDCKAEELPILQAQIRVYRSLLSNEKLEEQEETIEF